MASKGMSDAQFRLLSPAEIAELKKQKRSETSKRRRLRAQKREEEKKAAIEEAERVKREAHENKRWAQCLHCLRVSVPQLKTNPWRIIHEPDLIFAFLDALTEILMNFAKHTSESDIVAVRTALQGVHGCFVDLGAFARRQPCFYISNGRTIRRFVRLLEQVGHRESDKALFPSVLSVLAPTFEQEHLHLQLAEARVVGPIMSFVRTNWMPSAETFQALMTIIEQLSVTPAMRVEITKDAGFDRLCELADDSETVKGFSQEQVAMAKNALALYPIAEKWRL